MTRDRLITDDLRAEIQREVLPALEQIVSDVRDGVSLSRLASELGTLGQTVDGLRARRVVIVLEELGLVPALEWLAERIGDECGTIVEIDILGDETALSRRPPRRVERAAYRSVEAVLLGQVAPAILETVVISLAQGPDDLEVGVRAHVHASWQPRVSYLQARREAVEEAGLLGADLVLPTADPDGRILQFTWRRHPRPADRLQA